MNKIALGLTIMAISTLVAFGGESYSGKEVQQVVPPPPCPEWYRDTEWNVALWGTYASTAEDWRNDEYIEADHAWGGGIDLKYFFHRYFGIGIEGWAVDATRDTFDASGAPSGGGPPFVAEFGRDSRLIGGVKGTITLRYPIGCSRFAPYIYGGAGAIFGGGERDELVVVDTDPTTFDTIHHGDDTEFYGQVGGGIEVRITPHIGLINDFSWNFVGRDNSDFGMIRAGVNFAF